MERHFCRGPPVCEGRLIDGPPLPRIDVDQNPAKMARKLVGLFGVIEQLPCKVTRVQREIERQLVGALDPALAAAGRAMAREIDVHGERQDRQPYHSRQHFCEVMLVASVLCQLRQVPARSAQLVVLAAQIHDLGHDGQPNERFRLERASVARAMPHLVDAGVDATTRLQLATLVLATEPRTGVRAVGLAHRFHAAGDDHSDHEGDTPSELGLLARDEELSRLAILLCEADVLPSVGLTLAHALKLQHLLASEWGRPLGTRDKLAFIDDVLSAGVVGPFFLPNVLSIRDRLTVVEHESD